MTFEDLPPQWPTMSLSDPTLAIDVVDLLLKHSDRAQSSALLLLCDDEGRALQPVVVDGVDWHCIARDRALLFRVFGHLDVSNVIVAISALAPIDRGVALRWRDTARTELRKHGARLIGFYIADQDRVWEPPGREAA